MILTRKAKPSLTVIELDREDTLRFSMKDGSDWEMKLLDTRAEITGHDYAACGNGDIGHGKGDISSYAFSCDLRVNGRDIALRREVGTQACFYEPWLVDGVHIWFDAVADIFQDRGGFMLEKDWKIGLLCRPQRQARFALQEAGRSICSEPMAMWFDNPSHRIDIHDCYYGEDCWMGPYGGIATHCGLDINMPAGTVLHAPINFDDQYYVHSIAAGFNNNRWRGIRRWDDGSEWWLQSHHLIDLQVEQRVPLRRGTDYATSAGVATGAHEHTHFNFSVLDQDGSYPLDPWILFWQMFQDADSSPL